MKYYTAKGDTGTTKLLCVQKGERISKGDDVFETLGGLDELNSHLGLCSAVAERASFPGITAELRAKFIGEIGVIQQDLFMIQAELAGSEVTLPPEKLKRIEEDIEYFAGVFPQISSFVLPGKTELAALLDVARTIARRVERGYIRQTQSNDIATISPTTNIGAYLNRLSSVLYVLARFAVHAQGEREEVPTYQ